MVLPDFGFESKIERVSEENGYTKIDCSYSLHSNMALEEQGGFPAFIRSGMQMQYIGMVIDCNLEFYCIQAKQMPGLLNGS